MAFLPVTRKEMEEQGWDQPDFVLVTGDAYVDHPSFGHAIISRLLERYGYRVAILSQPDFRSAEDFRRFGRPRLGFLINSGNVDSMVNHYSVFKHRRKTDQYSPGGKGGRRPDRAVIVYSGRAKEAYRDVPVVIGGLEASLRRFSHYDYWSDRVRRSVLLDSKADLLIYGMGERAVIAVAEGLNAGLNVRDLTWIPGTVCRRKGREAEQELAEDPDTVILPPYSQTVLSKKAYGESFRLQYRNNDFVSGKRMAEFYGDDSGAAKGVHGNGEAGDRESAQGIGQSQKTQESAHENCENGVGKGVYVVQNPPEEPLSSMELDDVYELPYEGTWHPSYEKEGGVPAINEVKFSLVSNRGCFGGCAFCALTYHQGREVRARSRQSLIAEAKRMIARPDFKGYIHDVGGPTANFRKPACRKQEKAGVCRNKDCLYPQPCSAMNVDHSDYVELLRELRQLPGVKKVFIRSGIRYDYVMADPDPTFLKELCEHHISGTLKVAPEHVSPRVLSKMRKPSHQVFDQFSKEYKRINQELGKKQYLIPYFISSHPGSTLEDAAELAVYLKQTGFVPDQVQDFYPTPGTLSTCIYYTGNDPLTGEEVYTAKTMEEKRMQRALLHFHKRENRELVKKALKLAGREELTDWLLSDGSRKHSRKESR